MHGCVRAVKQYVLYVPRAWNHRTMLFYFVQHLSYKWHPQTLYGL